MLPLLFALSTLTAFKEHCKTRLVNLQQVNFSCQIKGMKEPLISISIITEIINDIQISEFKLKIF